MEGSERPRPADVASALSRLPLPRLAFDQAGVITAADERVPEFLGRPVDDLIGTNVLQVVHPDDLERCVAMFEFAPTANHDAIGPIPIRYLHADGTTRQCELWVQHRFDDADTSGFTLVAVPATVGQRLSEAIAVAAVPGGAHTPSQLVASALGARPLEGVGFVVSASGRVVGAPEPDAFGSDADPDAVAVLAPTVDDDGPWWSALQTGEPIVVTDPASLPEPWATAAAAVGVAALWCWPVHRNPDGSVPAVLALWRTTPGPPGPTHRVHLDGAVSVAALALDVERRRNRLEHMAYRDQLTGLASRSRLFGPGLQDDPSGSAVVYVDLDGFKTINDTHGHHAGDEVLVAVAGRIRHAVRNSDLVSRVGGDEFVIACPAPCPEEEAVTIAGRILAALAAPIRIEAGVVAVGASIGIAVHSDETTLEQLIRTADRALYDAKREAPGQYRVS